MYCFIDQFIFFFNDTATTEIYTLSLHDALPISLDRALDRPRRDRCHRARGARGDRKSTRLNSSHRTISYAVFCLKKKKEDIYQAKIIKVNEANKSDEKL